MLPAREKGIKKQEMTQHFLFREWGRMIQKIREEPTKDYKNPVTFPKEETAVHLVQERSTMRQGKDMSKARVKSNPKIFQ